MSTPRRPDRAPELPRSYQRTCLLVLLAESSCHGYELLEAVRGLGIPGADAGGLYRELRAMEREELVDSEWETSPRGPDRRSYRLNQNGFEALALATSALVGVRDLMDRLVQRCLASDPTGAEVGT